MSGPDVDKAAEVGEEEEPAPEAEGSGFVDYVTTTAGGLLSGKRSVQDDKKMSSEEWLSQAFGGSLSSTMADEDFAMTGLGAAAGTELDDVIAQVRGMNEAELSFLQRRLFQAGFYDGAVYNNASNVDWGMVDQATIKALQSAFEKAANNEVDNFDQFLNAEAARFRRTGITHDGSDLGSALKNDLGGQGERSVTEILLEDPDAIKITAEAIGTEILGRKPTETELAKVTQRIHSEQTRVAKERAAARQAAQPPQPTVDDIFGEQANLLSAGEIGVPIDYTPDPDVQMTPEQYENARIIMEVGQQMGLSEEYIVGALSAAVVESGLRNVNYGDRDSVGLFQQRPSQGWGTVEQILDPRYSARKFYEAMLRSDGATLGERVANTQRPAAQYRGRYAEQMNTAAGILEVVAGFRPTPRQADHPTAGVPPQARAVRSAPSNPRQADLAAGRSVANVGPEGRPEEIPRAPEEQPFWLDSYVGNSEQDPIFNTVMGVDVNASIAEELRRSDPVAYKTRQAAVKAYEFFAMLGAGGGLV